MTPERWQRIEKLYHDSQDRTPQERAAWLAQVCAGDETLRREVEVLLAANEQVGDFLNTPAFALDAEELTDSSITLPSGEVFSHYQILSKIGAGGMGEVYLARDTNLGRKVALKVLPLRFTVDQGRLQRFIREAKTASALNHPNIITIYEIGQSGEIHFIATEFIEGVTLRQRLNTGKLALGEVLEIARQIAAALDTAHRAGIIHRDIKPENIMLRPDGVVKVLDFGLAKLTESSTPLDFTAGQDLTTTAQGLLIGTPRYMSPEQARRQKVDARSDIFSFGVVCYEMMAGEPPFMGQNVADLFAALLSHDPLPLTHHVPTAPAQLNHIISKALAKDCAARYQTVRELQVDLQSLMTSISAAPPPLPAEDQTLLLTPTQNKAISTKSAEKGMSNATTSLSGRLTASLTQPAVKISPLMIVVGLLVLVGLLWYLWPRPTATIVPRELQFTQVFGKRGQDRARMRFSRFSPNGKHIAFAATGENFDGSNIWVRQLSSDRETQLTTGPWEEESPIWSPDGEQLAFISNRGQQLGIWTTPLLGGTPVLLKKLNETEAAAARREFYLIAWAKHEAAIYYRLDNQVIRFDLGSKETSTILPLELPFQTPQYFSLSPNEQEIAFVAAQKGQYDVWRINVRGGTPQRITNDSSFEQYPIWLSDHQILYNAVRDGQRSVYLTDLKGSTPTLIPTGDHQTQLADYAAANQRLLCYEQRDESDLYAVQLETGEEKQITNDLGAEFWASVAPNGQALLYQAIAGERFSWQPSRSAIFIKPLAGGPLTRLTADGSEPQWSPNGEQVAFLRLAGIRTLWSVKATGGEEKQLMKDNVSSSSYQSSPPYNRIQPKAWSWSPDSRSIAYCAAQDGVSNLWKVTLDETPPTQISTNSDKTVRLDCPLWSPDGQQLAYLIAPLSPAADKKTSSLWVTTSSSPTVIFQTESRMRLLGWTAPDRLLVALAENAAGTSTFPTKINLLEITLKDNSQRSLGELTETYLNNIHLAPNGRQLAFVKALNGRNDVWMAALSGNQLSPTRKLTNNNDPGFVLASLAWSPDSKTIYFDKQARWSLLTMVDPFN